MCGIAGYFNPEHRSIAEALPLLRSMGDLLAHRGPDDHGEYVAGSCGMAFRRLAIIDIVHGQQPMYSPRQKSVIVFNGEIYNYQELRRELSGKGVVFRSNSDTEVIVAGYETWGEEVVNKLRGIFSFAIHDPEKNLLFAARDHVGVKPFYYVMQDGYFVFGSEIKTLLKFPGVTASVRTSMLPRYMSFLWVPAPDTLFENISMLEPGHTLQVSQQGLVKKRYWNPDLTSCDSTRSEKQWMDLIDKELRRTVKEQMISDVPLGAFLSGGVDSSLIIAYMNQVSDQPVTTYTTGFRPEDMAKDVILSDLEHARIAAKHLNVAYNELILSTDVVDLLSKLVWHMDEPVADSAAITTYLICKAAKERCTVMLSGVGGDEVFGGYPRYLANQIADWYKHIPGFLRTTAIEWWVRRAAGGSSPFIRNAKKFIKNANMPFLDRYFGYLSYYSEGEMQQLLNNDFKWADIFSGHRNVYDEYGKTNPVQSMMNIDLKTFLPNLNLLYTDKMSSAASVEVRVPFLDHLLIEKAAAMPSTMKLRRLERKYLLKKIADKYLPKEIVWRKKAGFGAPVGAWLKDQAKEMMLDLLSEETIKRRGYFRYPFVKKLIDRHLDGFEYNANQLWQLLWLEVWHQTFIDR
ncbi:MAG: asparagine synthase (glutamine-hydrolyzing) [Nitrospirae bacterium]|nr:asparagine synthase (glutamine-hydrolyzing) [Nitrospirota bacterium]